MDKANDYYILSLSGGKDSTALGLEWLKRLNRTREFMSALRSRLLQVEIPQKQKEGETHV